MKGTEWWIEEWREDRMTMERVFSVIQEKQGEENENMEEMIADAEKNSQEEEWRCFCDRFEKRRKY